jgi:glutamate--cysteine ligase
VNQTLAPTSDQETIRSKDDLVRLFSDAVQPDAARMRVGPEMEKFGVTADGKPLGYESGVTRVLDSLEKSHGWLAQTEKAGGPRIALKRGEASVTLEPGGQLELSGAPMDDVHAIVAEMDQHLSELEPISKELGIRWLGVGFHPFAKLEDFSFVPKARYTIMREYLKTRGNHGLDMMHRTCTVQGNYDFTSLEDAMRKVRLGLKLAPLVAAMFANSPWLEGVAHGGVSYRAKVWLDVDPDRAGLLPSIWHEASTIGDYIEWALDVPMFLFKRNGEVVANTGQTFRSFWKSGFGGHVATQADWQLHVNTVFPEVRLKRTIEIRSADAQGRAIAPAVPGLYTGLYYDAAALAGAEALVRDWSYDEVHELQTRVWKDGLRATFKGAPLAKQAEALLDLARAGLVRRARLDAAGRDESVHLAALGKLVSKAMTPADELLERTRGATDPLRAILDAIAL